MRYSKCRPFSIFAHEALEVGTRSWIFFHISLHPIWELLFGPKTKACPLTRGCFEAGVETIGRFSIILRIISKSLGLRYAKDQDCFLQSARTLLRENTYIEEIIRSP